MKEYVSKTDYENGCFMIWTNSTFEKLMDDQSSLIKLDLYKFCSSISSNFENIDEPELYVEEMSNEYSSVIPRERFKRQLEKFVKSKILDDVKENVRVFHGERCFYGGGIPESNTPEYIILGLDDVNSVKLTFAFRK